jgi:hypothetical protein
MWRSSAHAAASFNNPIYRTSVEGVRKNAGNKSSRMCGGCHDIALLTEGAMDQRTIEPEDPRAHASITCRTCPGITAVDRHGNGSITLADRDVYVPFNKEPAAIAAHKRSVAPSILRTAELCAGCHRSFLDEDTGNRATVFGMDDFTAWSRSPYAKSHADRFDPGVAEQRCQDCHMKKVPATQGDLAAKNGKISSHQFFGGHTYLRAMQNDPEELRLNQEFLKGVASLKIHERAGAIDVVIKNESVGHNFPGGVLDAQSTWLEVQVFDARGDLLGKNEAHELRAEMVDADGNPVHLRETFRFLVAAWNHTIEARDARAVRYQLPKGAAKISARLLHRSRNLELQDAACREHQSERGVRFANTSRALFGFALDPCVEQPVTEIARAEHQVGATTKQDPAALYNYGLALSKEVQENLWEARAPLEKALQILGETGPRQRAQIHILLAQLSTRESELDGALEHLDRAELLIGETVASVCARAEAYNAVWHFDQAIVSAERCAALAPNDLRAAASYALLLASAGRSEAALRAADRGLLLHPLEPTLLRVRGLALESLGAPIDLIAAARAEFLRRRVPDGAPRARAKCSAKVPGCWESRQPVPHRTISSTNADQPKLSAPWPSPLSGL